MRATPMGERAAMVRTAARRTLCDRVLWRKPMVARMAPISSRRLRAEDDRDCVGDGWICGRGGEGGHRRGRQLCGRGRHR